MNSKTFTAVEKSNICKDFRLAKDPKKQITVLAELNSCSTSEIEFVLCEAGLLTSEGKVVLKPELATTKPTLRKPREASKQHHKWSPDEIDRLILLKSEGKSNVEIAEELGVSVASVGGQVHKFKNDIEQRKNTLLQDSQFCKICKTDDSKNLFMTSSGDCFIVNNSNFEETSSSEVKFAPLPYIVKPNNSQDSDSSLEPPELLVPNDASDPLDLVPEAINLLEEIQTIFNRVNLNSMSSVYEFGLLVGKESAKIDDLLERMKQIGK